MARPTHAQEKERLRKEERERELVEYTVKLPIEILKMLAAAHSDPDVKVNTIVYDEKVDTISVEIEDVVDGLTAHVTTSPTQYDLHHLDCCWTIIKGSQYRRAQEQRRREIAAEARKKLTAEELEALGLSQINTTRY